MKRFLSITLALILGVLLATTAYAQASKPAITQLFGFACDPTGKTCPDGDEPSSLIQSSDGNFYGTTFVSGSARQTSYGTVFRVTPSGQLTVIYTFVPGPSGQYPNGASPSSLVEGNDGFLYGTAYYGGVSSNGVVFKLSKTGVIQILYKFCSLAQCADGSGPDLLMLASDGNFYGGDVEGVLFRITPTGSFKVLHKFDSSTEGSRNLGMTQASDGNFYGETQGLNTNSYYGTVFELNSAGKVKLLHILNGSTDGADPNGGLIRDSAGNLYGVAYQGFGLHDRNGTVFKVTP